jgi:hypothetical protein
MVSQAKSQRHRSNNETNKGKHPTMENKALIQNNGDSQPISVVLVNPPPIKDFIAAVDAGVKSWERAGQLLVEMLNRDRTVFKKITEAYPHITMDMLEVFHSIGLRALYPLTMMLPRTVLPIVRSMRYDAQVEVNNNLITVVSRMVGDKPVIIQKPVSKLSREEAGRSLCTRGTRSVEWQVKSLKNQTVTSLLPKPAQKTAKEIERKPIVRAKFVVRRGPGGAFVMEKTMASPYNIQRVMLQDGQAVIELCEWGGAKRSEPVIE